MYQKLVELLIIGEFRFKPRTTLYPFRRSSHDLQRGNIAQDQGRKRPPGSEFECGASKAESCNQYLTKGKVLVEGRLKAEPNVYQRKDGTWAQLRDHG